MKKILQILPLIIVTSSLIVAGCNSVNPDTETIVTEESSSSAQAADLLNEYSSNNSEADQKYLDKVVTISGKVANAVETESGYNIEIEGKDELETISCAFDKSTLDGANLPEEGSSITVKGKITGYTEEELMGLKTINMVQCLIP